VERVREGPFHYVNVTGDGIYYRNQKDSGRLYRANLDGTGATKLADDEMAFRISVVGDMVYYRTEAGAAWVKTDGSGAHPVE